jgi:hypothetical protein
MRMEQGDHRASQSEEQTFYEHDARPAAPVTPARRAALEALEREFRDMLRTHSR